MNPLPIETSRGRGTPARWIALAVIAAFVSACGGGGNDGAMLASQSVSEAAMRGAACSYSHVYITVQTVRALQVVNGTGQWVGVALPAPKRIDLSSLDTGLLQALGAALLPAGEYTQVQLVLASNDATPMANAVQPTGGQEAALATPGAQQSGLKVLGDFVVPEGQAGDVVLQGFDACGSIVVAGRPGAPTYELKPTLSATVRLGAVVAPELAFGAANISVWPIAGGGYMVTTQNGTAWTVQRYGADRQPAGPLAAITLGGDLRPELVPLAGGGYAATWLSLIETHQMANGNYASTYQVWVQSFGATGVPVGAPIPLAQVNPGAVARQAAVGNVAALTGGGFVVVWGLQQAAGTDVHDPAVYAQVFQAAGTPAGAPIQVAPDGTGALNVAGTTAGGFIVSFGSLTGTTGGVRAFSATGAALGAVQPAGNTWAGNGPLGELAPIGGGGAVLVWSILHEHLRVQQVGPDGTPLPAQVVDDATAAPVVAYAAVLALPDGGYVIAWSEAGGGVFARRYAASGAPVGAQTQVNTFTTNTSNPVGVALLADGGFMITWVGTGTDGVARTYSRTYPANGLT